MTLNDQDLITKLEVDKKNGTIRDFVAKEVMHHYMCRVELQRRAEQKSSHGEKTKWHEIREVHSEAFEVVKNIVQESVIVNEEGYFLKDLVSKYISVLREVGGDGFEEITFTSQHLQDKLKSYFGNNVLFDEGNKRRGNIVYNSKTDLDVAVRNAFENSSDASKKIQDAAFILRKEITSSNKRSLPQSLTLEDIIKGEIDSPDLLYEFLSHVIFGYDRQNRESSIKKRRVNSISHDIIYAITGGAVKPAKHLLMGLAFKSMTGSRHIIEILNRLGHSISYNATEELETELTFFICDRR